MKSIKRLVEAATLFCFSFSLQAQILPTTDLLTGSTGITYTTPNTWQNYTYTFTPTTTGANYVGFAFRQDPAYWTIGNISLTTGNGSNLLINGNFANGGTIAAIGIQAPQYWGVWYQGGTPPPANGTWYAPGDGWNGTYTGGQGVNYGTAGSWIDGAVGSFDGIYQGISLTAGTLYTLTFSVYGNNAVYSGVQLGAYAGTCADATVAAASCTINTANGFTTWATPEQGATASSGPTQTGWTTAPSSYGSWGSSYYNANSPSSTYTLTALTRSVTARALSILRTVTPYNVYATYQDRTVTPMVYPTYSDNTTGTTAEADPNHAAYTETRQVTDTVIQGTATNTNFSTRIDQFAKLERANVNANSLLDSNVLDRHTAKNGAFIGKEDDITGYVIADGNRSNTADSYKMTGSRFGVGFDYRYAPDVIVGAQYNHQQLNLAGTNGSGSLTKEHFGVYSAVNLEEFLIKSDLSVSFNKFGASYAIPELGYSNTATTRGTDYWFNTRVYTPDLYGFRPFAAVRWDHNKVNATTATGSAFTAVDFAQSKSNAWSEEVGVSYSQEVVDNLTVNAEVSRTTMNYRYGTVAVNYKVNKDSSIDVKVGQQRWDDVRNNLVQAHVKVLF